MTELTKISGCGSGHPNCKNSPENPHSCPYQEDINNDHEFECTCCEDCEAECLADI